MLHSTLSVADSTFILKTLDVCGSTMLRSTLSVKASTYIMDTLDISGATRIMSTLSIGSTLNVCGATTLQSTLCVYDITYLQNQLSVHGSTKLQNTIDVCGAVVLWSTLSVAGPSVLTGKTYLNDVSANGVINITGTMNVMSTLYIDPSLIVIDPSNILGHLNNIPNNNAGEFVDFVTLFGVKSENELTEYISGTVNASNKQSLLQPYEWTIFATNTTYLLPPDATGSMVDTGTLYFDQSGSFTDVVNVNMVKTVDISGSFTVTMRNHDTMLLTMNTNIQESTQNILDIQRVLYVGIYIPYSLRFRVKFKSDFDEFYADDARMSKVHNSEYVEFIDSSTRDEGSKCFVISYLQLHDLPLYVSAATNTKSYYKSIYSWSTNPTYACKANGYWKLNDNGSYSFNVTNDMYPCMTITRWCNDNNDPLFSDPMYDSRYGWGSPDPSLNYVIANYDDWMRELYRITYRYIAYDNIYTSDPDPTPVWADVIQPSLMDLTYTEIFPIPTRPSMKKLAKIRLRFKKTAFASLGVIATQSLFK